MSQVAACLVEIFTIQPDEIDRLWDLVRPHLERFERETQRTDAETMRRQVRDRERQLWGLAHEGEITGVVVTEIYPTARGNVCWIWAAAGSESLAGMRQAYEEIEGWARSLGCVSIGIQGRKGWQRVLPQMKQTAVVLEMTL